MDAHLSRDDSTQLPILPHRLVLMFVTLCLYTPIVHVARIVPQPQKIKDYFIAPGTMIHVSGSEIHTASSIWGSNSLEFIPSHWLRLSSETPGCETLPEPLCATSIPWSVGPRFGPGFETAQVEFFSMIFTIFSKWRIETVRQKSETEQNAKDRLAALISDSSTKLTLQTNRPQDMELGWVAR